MKTRPIKTDNDLKYAQEIVTVSDFQQKSLKDTVASLTEEVLSISVECVSIKADLDAMMELVQRMMDIVKE